MLDRKTLQALGYRRGVRTSDATSIHVEDHPVNGYSLSYDELEIEMCAIVVPVRGCTGTIEAAVSVSAFSGRLSVEAGVQSFLPVPRRVAQRIERAL